MSRLLTVLAWIALLLGLTLPALYPRATNIGVLVIMALGLLMLFVQRRDFDIFRQKGIATLLSGCAVLFVALLPTARSVEHVVAIFIVAPLIFAGCYVLMLKPITARITPLLIGSLALVGALGGAAISGYEVLALGAGRGGGLVNNPIHLADLSVALGFIALVGLYDRSPWRWLMLIGPLAALAAIFWTGSRGPLLGFAALSVVAGAYLVFTLLHGSRALRWAFGLALALGLAVSPFVEVTLGGRVVSMSSVIGSLVDPNAADYSSQLRAVMYQSAWGAFQASPIYGHGMVDFARIAAQYAPTLGEAITFDHLHSDIADFMVTTGTLGLLAYLLILAAPIMGAFRARGPALYLALVMSVGYFVMGLTNAMIGVLTQTVLFAVVTALIAVLASKQAAPETGTA